MLRPPPEAATAASPTKPARRWWKVAALASASLFLLTAVALSALWWWAGTSGSLDTALGWIGQSQPIMAKGATGSLRSGGQIEQLVWEQDGLRVDTREVTLAWQPWSLLQGTLKLQRIAAASVTVDDQRPPRTVPASAPTAIGLPLPISLDAFSVDQLQWNGATAFAASGISGRYEFTGLQHQLDLLGVQVASGRYSGQAVVSSSSPFVLDARLTGALTAMLPKSNAPLPLTFQATANGPLTEFKVQADLKIAESTPEGQKSGPTPPQASAAARVTPWAAQPLPQADARFSDLDLAALWPNAPQTQLTGSASVRPMESAAPAASLGWRLQLDLANQLPGPWDQRRLPLDRLEAQGEWRGGTGIVRTLKARLGGGELLASGEWTPSPAILPAPHATTGTPSEASPVAPATAPAWTLQATLKKVNPALLHSQVAALPLNGVAAIRSQGAAIGFDASVQTAPGTTLPSLGQLVLRDAKATGSWSPEQAGGTLVLSALRARTDDAELTGELEVQPSAQGGKGNLALIAPGLNASIKGELRKSSGAGTLSLRGQDAAQLLRWLQKLPGLPASLQAASATGSAELQASWQGGWLDPALQARLSVPSLDWRSPSAKPGATTAAAPAQPPASLLKIRDLNGTLSGRLSQAQLSAQGRLEIDQRRVDLQLALDGGRTKQAGAGQTAFSASAWKGVLKQFLVRLEDPALGAGAWQLASRGSVPLSWTPTAAGGAFESGAGQAILSAPRATASSPAQATLAWQPVRWRPGELLTAGSITGLPMAWIEHLGGAQLAGAGLSGNLLLDGQWDARLSDRLALKAGLTRSSGDLTVQADTAQGSTTRVAAGVRQAQLSLESVGEALTLALRWDSERAGTADGQFKTRLTRAPPGTGFGGWLWPADAPLNGKLRIQLPRLGVWSVLAPPGWRLRGALAADIAISGSRAAPQLAGELQANDMALRSVVDGIEFGKGRLRATLDGTRMRISEFSLQGAGEKGTGGQLMAQGEAAWVDGQPQVQLTAKLSRLRASIRTDREVTVSGELQASLKGARTELTGKLVVDQARILLPDEGTPQLGDDVVVRMAGGAAAGPKGPGRASAPEKEKAARPLKLAVQIDLGRDFRIQGKGIDTRILGVLSLNDDAQRGPRLTGTVNTFGGQYRAYGQRLDVEQGVIRFTGAIDNPTLDILAIRPNLTQRVGVQITGTALLPSVRLYAQPELPDAEKLSWLVVGHASASGGAEAALLQQAALALLGSKSGGMSGGLAASLGLDVLSFRGASSNADGSTAAGAITLGKRFSSNFYAAYERSISGALGTLYVFYDLSQRFTIRAQAGQQSAVDLIYTVPYD